MFSGNFFQFNLTIDKNVFIDLFSEKKLFIHDVSQLDICGK